MRGKPMNLTAETTAQRLAQSVRQFNKAFMQFNRTELHQSFAGCKPKIGRAHV